MFIPMTKIREMSDKELLELSQQRNTKGLYTPNAENAMRVRRERSGAAQWHGVRRKAPLCDTQEIGYNGTSFTKKFK